MGNVLDDIYKAIDALGPPPETAIFIIPAVLDPSGKLVPATEKLRRFVDEMPGPQWYLLSEYAPLTDKDGNEVLYTVAVNPATLIPDAS